MQNKIHTLYKKQKGSFSMGSVIQSLLGLCGSVSWGRCITRNQRIGADEFVLVVIS